ncbi:asparagine synthetase A [Streptomyces sp. NPDC000941]
MPLDPSPTAGQEQAFVPPQPHEHLASATTRNMLLIQSALLQGAREYLCDEGFVELLPPVVGPVTDPGCRGAKQVDIDYYGRRYKLMTSVIFYKQAALLAHPKIFYIAPCVRLEPFTTSSTLRHLTEFHQIDVEAADTSREEMLEICQGVVRGALRRVIKQLPHVLDELGRDPGAFTDLLEQSFPSIRHMDVVETLHKLGHEQNPDGEIDWEGEALISRQHTRPFFITDYPKGSRGFPDRESRTLPGRLRNFDLVAPEGYGELCSGSEREGDYTRVIERMRETGENPAKYEWYLKTFKEGGIPQSAGFGLGAQRLTRYAAGLHSVWQASAFPKLPGVMAP